MKTITICIISILMLCILHGHAQKPNVQVNFQFEEDGLFFDFFEDDIDLLQTEIRSILINHLNKYIGFIDFGTESSDYQFDIRFQTIQKLATDEGKDHILTFTLNTPDNIKTSEPWVFMDREEFNVFRSASAEDIIDKFEEDWDKFLPSSFQHKFVTDLFNEVPITLTDCAHVFHREADELRDLIVPFQSKDLKLRTDGTQFSVKLEGRLSSGLPRNYSAENVHCTGLVDRPTWEVLRNENPNCELLDFFMIDITNSKYTEFVKGEIYVLTYDRDPNVETEESTTADLLNEINNDD
ncbi:hypothetical protein [Flavivirga spongiicola]|uniref:GLPGLI family protein n=1 Tax=Flavivirga spongiicola TaxID=421621 RepID=A0ABU7XMF9_9FLAO|nr:hypothetical protein [Flavivirga sp. MEBiC05379]MDO5981597.1 hypothetical protein [Flavivirga sp. MEBiC05379]